MPISREPEGIQHQKKKTPTLFPREFHIPKISRLLHSSAPMAILRRPLNNNNPWPECGKDGAHQQGLCVHPSIQPLQNTRSRPSQNEPWHDCQTQHYNSWPCLQSNVLFHNLNTPLHSGSPLPKSKAWKNNPCPWTYIRTRKQMSLCTMEVDSAIECCQKKVPLATTLLDREMLTRSHIGL